MDARDLDRRRSTHGRYEDGGTERQSRREHTATAQDDFIVHERSPGFTIWFKFLGLE